MGAEQVYAQALADGDVIYCHGARRAVARVLVLRLCLVIVCRDGHRRRAARGDTYSVWERLPPVR